MAIELEYKLAVPSAALLEQILFDKQLAEVRTEGFRMYDMATVYYDTADRVLKQKRWTLRLRQENHLLVATLKTPAGGRARAEYECEAASIPAAIPLLLAQGAPEALGELDGDALHPLCTAQFTRRAANLQFADGTVCELAGDIGMLAGGKKQENLCEVELELKSGSADVVKAFADKLMKRFGLQEEPRSKFARAAALAEEDA